jgi:threonine/homoserine/homoserine lactone efflux protein
MMAQAIGAWLIALGVAAGQTLAERDARRLRPAAAGSVLLAVFLAIALARYPHQFHWGSAAGVTYLIFLATMLLTGAASLARGLPRAARQSTLGPAHAGKTTGEAGQTQSQFKFDNTPQTQAALAAAPASSPPGGA